MKKSRRTGIAVILTAALAGMILTGCEAGSKKRAVKLDPKNPTTVTVWNYYNGDQLAAFENLVGEFNSTVGLREGIVVVSVSQGSINNLADTLIDSVNGKAGAADIPSLASVYAETAYVLEEEGAIQSLDGYFSAEELAEYVPAFIEEGRLKENGELYLFPISKSTETFVVNETDWAEFEAATGISSQSIGTIEDLTCAAKEYYDYTDGLTPDIPEDGRALYGRDSVANYIFIGTKQLGHAMFHVKEDGTVEVDMDQETFHTLWDNYYIPYINGYFSAYANHRSEDMKTGALLAMTCSTSGVNYISNFVTEIDDTSHEIELSVREALQFENAVEKVAVQQGAGYCVMKTTAEEEYAAVNFLKWFTETEQNVEFSVASAYSPVKLEANSAEVIEEAYRKMKDAENANVLQALLMSSDIYRDQESFTNKPFGGSKEIRDSIASALEMAAKNDRAAVIEKISKGMSREEAAAEFMTEEYFTKWFTSVCDEVERILR